MNDVSNRLPLPGFVPRSKSPNFSAHGYIYEATNQYMLISVHKKTGLVHK